MSITIDYKNIFERTLSLYLVIDPDYRIVDANDAYARATRTKKSDIVGRGLFEVFPDNPNDPEADGVANLTASLERVKKFLLPDPMAVQKYDVRLPPEEGGGFVEKYWSPVNIPVLDAQGKLQCILHRVEDITDYIHLKMKGQASKLELKELKERTIEVEAEILIRNQQIEKTRDVLQAELQTKMKDITALVERLAEKKRKLELALEEAEKLSRMKSNFLNLMSHEIRTPLNLMQLQIYTLKEEIGKDLSPFHAQVIENLLHSSKRLLNLMESLLNYARIQSGRLALHVEEVDTVEAIAETVEELAPLAVEKKLALRFTHGDELRSKLQTDRDLLRLAVVNLIVNAIKYTDRGEIEVSVKEVDGVHRISIRDTGQGIGIDQQEAIFEPFEQLETVSRKHKSGVGLGLAISKGMVGVLGGKIELVSRPGQGSTFSIVLPAVYPSASGDPTP